MIKVIDIKRFIVVKNSKGYVSGSANHPFLQLRANYEGRTEMLCMTTKPRSLMDIDFLLML